METLSEQMFNNKISLIMERRRGFYLDDYDEEERQLFVKTAEKMDTIDPKGSLGRKRMEKLNAILDTLQLTLDVAGFIPGFSPLDILNGLIYLSRGRLADSLISFVSAVPAGDIVKLLKVKGFTKSARATVKFLRKIKPGLKFASKSSKWLKIGRSLSRTKLFLNKKFKAYIDAVEDIVPFIKFSKQALHEPFKKAEEPDYSKFHDGPTPEYPDIEL